MPLNLASPGIVVREIDLTTGQTNPSQQRTGGLVAPFAKGPVDSPVTIGNENDLLNTFGDPTSVDNQYEDWLVASSYLAYGGDMLVIRANGDLLRNGFVGTASSVKIDSVEDYQAKGYDENILANVTVAARNPGSWSNGINVAIIDGKSDQILSGITTAAILVGYGITQSLAGKVLPGAGSTSALDDYFLKAIVTEVLEDAVEVKVLSRVDSQNVEEIVDYTPNSIYAFTNEGEVNIESESGNIGIATYSNQDDWFDQQTVRIGLGTDSATIPWNQIAPRPGTSGYAKARNSRFDETHVVVVDAIGGITGNAGTLLEKNLSLSKASDSEFSVGSPSYWRKFLENASDFIFGLSGPEPVVATGFNPNSFEPVTDFAWDQSTEGIIFGGVGNVNDTLAGGTNYDGLSNITNPGALETNLAELSDGYTLFEADDLEVDFLLMGSAAYDISTAQALASKLISVAEIRKDCIALISPYRGAFLQETANQGTPVLLNAPDITQNVLEFYAPIPSSSYAVFDSGYKYMFDRFSQLFRYVPLNGDIAGTCARTDINQFPWFSPAGTNRGAILNAIKLAYNPTQAQRDILYSARINPVIFSPGAGIVLFGDRTGLATASAFDRINVRRLFIFLEEAISDAAKDVLFEFNDEITRTNFVNTIEPLLRDVQANRGIFDYVVVCDETNNTAAVIDRNEFIADIYIKPARSINFIGLNFIATRTGVDFEEVIGNFS